MTHLKDLRTHVPRILRNWPNVLIWSLLIYVSYPAVVYLYHRWISTPEMSHGIAVPIISAGILIYGRFSQQDSNISTWYGILPLSIGLLFLVSAVWADIGILYGLSLPFEVIGTCWLLYGYGWVRARAFALLFLFMAIPWPDFLTDKLSVPLQQSSAALSGVILRALMPISSEGVHLWTPRFDAEVTVACSGIRSFMAITTVAALIAAWTPVKRGWQCVLFVSSIPMALVANVLRIVLIFLVGHYINGDFALTLFHDDAGILLPVMTGICLGAIRHFMISRMQVAPEDTMKTGSSIPMVCIPRVTVTVTLLLIAIWSVQVANADGQHTKAVHIQTVDVPYKVGEWTATNDTNLPDEAMELLTPDAVVNRTYRYKSGRYTELLIIYGHHKNSFHSPSYCLPGDGWNLQREYEIQIKGASSSIPFRVMLMEKNNSRILVVYSYIQPDGACVGLIRHYFRLAKRRLQHQISMGASLRLVIPTDTVSDSIPENVLPLCKAISTIVQRQLNRETPANRQL